MILTTERLLLRPWCEADAEMLYRIAKDADVAHPAGWQPHTSAAHSCEIIRGILCKPTVFAVCTKDSCPIGNIHLDPQTPLRQHDGECELGYWLGKAYWGQGFMTEAARALLVHAFEQIGVCAVWSGYYEGNERSRRVQEKLGFVYHHTDMTGDKTVHRTYLKKENWGDNHNAGIF